MRSCLRAWRRSRCWRVWSSWRSSSGVVRLTLWGGWLGEGSQPFWRSRSSFEGIVGPRARDRFGGCRPGSSGPTISSLDSPFSLSFTSSLSSLLSNWGVSTLRFFFSGRVESSYFPKLLFCSSGIFDESVALLLTIRSYHPLASSP